MKTGESLMKTKNMIIIMEIGAILVIFTSLLMIATLGTLPGVGPIYSGISVFLLLTGLLFLIKLRKAERRLRAKERLARKIYVVIILLGLALSVSVVHMAGKYSRECLTVYQRVVYVEYTMLGMLLISGFLAFGPILLGRTILGPILQELQYIAGAMLILLIFTMLILFPLDPLFEFDNAKNPTGCIFDPTNLKSAGPPLLRLLYALFSPPPQTFQ